MKVSLFFWLIFCAVLSVATSGAAEIEVLPGKGKDAQLIVITGEIQNGDETKFADLAIRSRSGVVVLASPGGAIVPAIEIGKTVRIKGFVTYVGPESECTSACALIWLAGRQRSMSAAAKIGFHAAYTVSGGLAAVNGPANALVGAYLSQLGLPDAAVVYVTSAPPAGMRWLNLTEANAIGLEVKLFDIAEDPAVSAASQGNAPAAVASSLEQQAFSFVTEFIALDASNEPTAFSEISKRYAAFVFYYGKYQPRVAIAKDHEKFAARWPKRSQSIKAETLKVQCDEALGRCQVSALIEWIAVSEQRNARSTGTSTWALTLERSPGGFKISAISGKVLNRQLSGLHPNGIACLLGAC